MKLLYCHHPHLVFCCSGKQKGQVTCFMKQYFLQEAMQQHLSGRKGDIYRYHSETRQQVTIQLLWHLTRKSRAAENMFGELRKNVICFRGSTLPPVQTPSAIAHHVSSHIHQKRKHGDILIPSSVHLPMSCTCLMG